MDGLSAAIFRGGMHPVELAGRVVRHADLMVREETGGPAIPNRFDVRVNPKDLPDVDVAELAREVKWCLPDVVCPVDFRTCVDQHRCDRGVALLARDRDRSCAARAALIDESACLHQQLDTFAVAEMHRIHQRCPALVVGVVHHLAILRDYAL